MADSSVLLEVIVEGKNIKVVQRDVESLAASVNKASGAEEKSTKGRKRGKKATDDLTDSNKNYNRAPEIAALVLASSIGILLDKWGRKNVALIGFVMLVIDHKRIDF